MNEKQQAYRTIGWVTGAHGLQGHVMVRACDDDPVWAQTLKQVLLADAKGERAMTINAMSAVGQRVRIKFKEINTRNEAEKLKGMSLKVPEKDLPTLQTDEFYTDSLLGLNVVSEETQKVLGTVRDVVSAHQGEYLEVAPAEGGDTQLIPFLEVFIGAVDLPGKRIHIKGLDSLFEPEPPA